MAGGESTTLTDDQILKRAAQITRAWLETRQQQEEAELKRLYRQYGRRPLKLEFAKGMLKKLTSVEALLVAALDRTYYRITTDCPNNNRWHGDTECAYHVRESVIVMMQDSRLELLWELWRCVSDQTGGCVTVTEYHLQGSVSHRHLRELGKELRDVRNL